MEFDDLLKLEEKFYNEGVEDGRADGAAAGLLEGKQFGLQTGFQRYSELGTLQGRLDVWKMSESKSERVEKALGSLESLISDPPRSNKESDAEQFEKLLRKAKPKAKSVCALNGDKIPIVIHGRPVPLKANDEEIEDSF